MEITQTSKWIYHHCGSDTCENAVHISYNFIKKIVPVEKRLDWQVTFINPTNYWWAETLYKVSFKISCTKCSFSENIMVFVTTFFFGSSSFHLYIISSVLLAWVFDGFFKIQLLFWVFLDKLPQ